MPEVEATEENGSHKRSADEITPDEPPGAVGDTKDTDKEEDATVDTDKKEDTDAEKEEEDTDKKEEEDTDKKEDENKDEPTPENEPEGDPSEADAADKPNPYEALRYTIVQNDGEPGSMIKLVGLKSLFAKQLPKMPRAYIARLVFDRRHTSLAILSDNPELEGSDEEIVGGICYRAFPEMRFAGE